MKHTLRISPTLQVSRMTCNVGPRHDPYLLETWVVQHNDGTKVVAQESSLRLDTKVDFFSDYQTRPVRSVQWEYGRGSLPGLKADLLAKQAIGITIKAAQEAWQELERTAEPDPMGPASHYI